MPESNSRFEKIVIAKNGRQPICKESVGFASGEMNQTTTQPYTYSVGQAAKRWGISSERVRQLIDAGNLVGNFSNPSAGRFGKALRIPVETVLASERNRPSQLLL
jgi:hypothetical protein